MVRFVIIGIVIAVAFTLYALVDAAMTDGARARGVGKPVWIVLIVLLPVVGGVLWFLIGKGASAAVRPQAPDDDPRFAGTRMSTDDLDVHMRDLEARLRELDEETFPGERPAEASSEAADDGGADATGSADAGAGAGGSTGSGDASGAGTPADGATSEGAGGAGSGETGSGGTEPGGTGSGTPGRPGDGDTAQPR